MNSILLIPIAMLCAWSIYHFGYNSRKWRSVRECKDLHADLKKRVDIFLASEVSHQYATQWHDLRKAIILNKERMCSCLDELGENSVFAAGAILNTMERMDELLVHLESNATKKYLSYCGRMTS